jgi:hypothetical protein
MIELGRVPMHVEQPAQLVYLVQNFVLAGFEKVLQCL